MILLLKPRGTEVDSFQSHFVLDLDGMYDLDKDQLLMSGKTPGVQ